MPDECILGHYEEDLDIVDGSILEDEPCDEEEDLINALSIIKKDYE